MNNRMMLLVVVLFISLSALLPAMEIKKGVDIASVEKAMKKAGYPESGLSMIPVDPKNRLAFWSVDEGVLIVMYSSDTKKVNDVTFWLSDERAKAERMTFEYDVKSFDSKTGTMVLQTKLPKRKKD